MDRSVAETIENITIRLQTSTRLDDRRDASRGLRALAKDYRVEVCAQAMETLLQAIKIDRQDTEMMNHCLDALNYIICGPLADSPAATWPDSEADQTPEEAASHNNLPPSSGSSQHPMPNPLIGQATSHSSSFQSNHPSSSSAKYTSTSSRASAGTGQNHDIGRELAEIFLKKADNVTTILDTIIDNDFKTRWGAVRLLCGLARQKLVMVQDSILSFPLGVSRLVQLITEEQEVIRNDALVLFVKLTQANQNMQNLVAFENCFEKIMYIIELEGYLDGTVAVVMDCLNILLNLTQSNESNQILFREGSHIQRLLPFFNNVQTIQWTSEKTACLILVLQIVDSMILPTNSPIHVQACQNIMQRCGLLDKLCELLSASSMPIGVLSETMNTASDIVRGHLGPNANMVMQTSSIMPVMLLSMMKEMCHDQEKRIADLYNYVHLLHDFLSNSCIK